MVTRVALVTACVLSLHLCTGCFKSSTSQASSESSSDSSKSSSKSSSSSSPDGESETAYLRDVRDYTARFAAATGPGTAFQRDLGQIAARHGITNWEADRGTFIAIGFGLAKAGLDEGTARAFATEVASSDLRQTAWVTAGHAQALAR